MAVLVLIDHAAHRVRIEAGEGAVQHHLRHRDLAAHRFAAGFEIHRLGETLFVLGARLVVEQAEPLGRRLGALVVGVDLALGGDALAALGRPDGRAPAAATPSPSCRDRTRAGHHDDRLLAGLPASPCFRRAAERGAAEEQARGLQARNCRAPALAPSGSPTADRARPSDRRAAAASSDIDTIVLRAAAARCSASASSGSSGWSARGQPRRRSWRPSPRRSEVAGSSPAGAASRRASAASGRAHDEAIALQRAVDAWGNRRPDSAAAAAAADCASTEP